MNNLLNDLCMKLPSNPFRKARYTGPIPELQGKTALIWNHNDAGWVYAQFDEMSLGTWATTGNKLPAEQFEAVT